MTITTMTAVRRLAITTPGTTNQSARIPAPSSSGEPMPRVKTGIGSANRSTNGHTTALNTP